LGAFKNQIAVVTATGSIGRHWPIIRQGKAHGQNSLVKIILQLCTDALYSTKSEQTLSAVKLAKLTADVTMASTKPSSTERTPDTLPGWLGHFVRMALRGVYE